MICTITPAAPLTYFTDGKGVRGIFGSMKDAGIFLGSTKNHLWVFFGCFFCQLKSTIKSVQFTAGVGVFWMIMLKT